MSHPAGFEESLGLTVADIMSRKVHAAGGEDPVDVVLGRIRGHALHHMPVVDREGALIGVVADRDLLSAVHVQPTPLVREVMTRLTVSVSPDTTAKLAAKRVLEVGVGCLPVLEDGRLVGMVTTTDFVMVAHRALALLEMLATPSEPS